MSFSDFYLLLQGKCHNPVNEPASDVLPHPLPTGSSGLLLLVYCQFQSMSWGALAAVDNINVPFALPDKKVDAGSESWTGCAPVWLLCSHLTQHSCCSIHHQRSSMSPKVTSFPEYHLRWPEQDTQFGISTCHIYQGRQSQTRCFFKLCLF